MFGIFYLIANTIGLIFSGTNQAIRNKQNMDWWKDAKEQGKNPHNLYMDRRGAMRSLTNHQPVTITHLYRTGDIIRKEGDADKSFVNLSAAWREREFQRLRYVDNEHTVFPDIKIIHAHPTGTIDFEEHTWDDRWYAKGQWWKDYKTGHLYCVREISDVYDNKQVKINCYMDIQSGLLVRVTDEQRKKKLSTDMYEKIIDNYNAKKKKQEKPKNLNGWDNFYLNYKIDDLDGYLYLREVQERMEKAGCCPV